MTCVGDAFSEKEILVTARAGPRLVLVLSLQRLGEHAWSMNFGSQKKCLLLQTLHKHLWRIQWQQHYGMSLQSMEGKILCKQHEFWMNRIFQWCTYKIESAWCILRQARYSMNSDPQNKFTFTTVHLHWWYLQSQQNVEFAECERKEVVQGINMNREMEKKLTPQAGGMSCTI